MTLDSLLDQGRRALNSGDTQGALEFYGNAAALAIETDNPMHLGRAYAGMADCYGILGDIDQAREYYLEQALPIFKDPQHIIPRGEAITTRALADLERRIGNRDSARVYYARSLYLFKTLQDDVGQAIVLHGMGELERAAGRTDSARADYEQADSLLRASNHILGQANVLHSLGDLEFSVGNKNQARAHYSRALTLSRQAGNPLGEANALYGLGNVAVTLREDSVAQQNLDAAMTIYERIGNRLGQANICVARGDLAGVQHDYPSAVSNYTRALSMFRGLKMDSHAERTERKLRVTTSLRESPEQESADQ
jgi:tetratricopeptide (TPR) repeat protein